MYVRELSACRCAAVRIDRVPRIANQVAVVRVSLIRVPQFRVSSRPWTSLSGCPSPGCLSPSRSLDPLHPSICSITTTARLCHIFLSRPSPPPLRSAPYSRPSYHRRCSPPLLCLARTRSPRKLPYVNKASSLQSSPSPTQQQHPATKLLRHAAAPSSIAAPNAILPTPVYTPIDTAIAPGHCSRLRLETKGNRGLAPTTARAGFGAHL